MDNGYMQEIKERILQSDDGSIFVASDFADIADSATIRQSLQRLYKTGVLNRIIRGVYHKPKYSKLLNEYVSPNPDLVAKAIARNYHWTIAPCGNTAINLLGLSTQVAAVYSYISDGPYKSYAWDKTKIEFNHRTNKEITGLSYTTSLVIQALKTIGKDNITIDVIDALKRRLSSSEKQVCLKEASESTDWVFDTIRKICKGNINEKYS